jgi:hypothetical protein
MSKAAAIHAAVSLQLSSENKTVNLREALGAVIPAGPNNNPPERPAAYTADTIRGFLANVAFRLRADSPPLAFKWDAIDPQKCLTDQLWVVELAIAAVTSDVTETVSQAAPTK